MRLIFGGTFDPVHNGHIQMASELSVLFEGAPVYLMPCAQAVHKKSVSATAHQRKAMLELACQENQNVLVDDRELSRGGASYTINSIAEIRREMGSEPLCLVMGDDSAQGLASWKSIKEFASLCHLLVIRRPKVFGYSYSEDIDLDLLIESLGWSSSNDLASLRARPHGLYTRLALSDVVVSSTLVRQRVAEKLPLKGFVPDAVNEFICDNGLYAYASDIELPGKQ